MSILMILRIALKALSRNKMRTALTMLGMIIGVAAVITMVALGSGAQTSIEAQIQSAGTNMIIVSAGNFSQGGVRQGQGNASTLVPDDAAAIAQLPGVQYTAAGSNVYWTPEPPQSSLIMCSNSPGVGADVDTSSSATSSSSDRRPSGSGMPRTVSHIGTTEMP